MTYGYTSYQWSAFAEADLLGSNSGTSINCGDKFRMPAAATVKMLTFDNDGSLSGDGTGSRDDQATDSTGQDAYVNGARVGSQVYAEVYHVLQGSNGKCYFLIEIEVEGYDAPGVGDDYFTFYGDVPPAGVELCVTQTVEVTNQYIDYRCLGAGTSAPANTPPYFTNVPANGIICVDENTKFVIDLNASDANNDSLTYKIVGGADASLFEINAHTGVVTFKGAPDFENPHDQGRNNVYDIKVEVCDPKGGSQTKDLWVKVSDVPENGWIKGRLTTDADCNDNEFNDQTQSYDAGIAGATIQLLDLSGKVVATAVTDAHGNYMFDVPAGDYRVKFPNPEGKQFSAQNSGVAEHFDSDADANGLTGVIHVGEGSTTMDVDAGIKVCGATTCVVIEAESMTLCDYEVECRDNASRDANIKLTSATGTATTTWSGPSGDYDFTLTYIDESDGRGFIDVFVNGHLVGCVALNQDNNGDGGAESTFSEFTLADLHLNTGDVITLKGRGNCYEFARIDKIQICKDDQPEPGAITGRLFCDENNNNVDDAEPGIGGVTVQLLNAGGTVITSAVTAADGSYSFTGLDAGQYSVRFPTVVDGKILVVADQGGDDTIDSDANQTTGQTGSVTVVAGETTRDVDAGVEDPGTAAITGRVFCDENHDDVDNGEPGVGSVTVRLLNAGGLVIATTQTASDGSYSFTGLNAGTYSVVFDETTAGGKRLVAADQGGDDTIDSDASQTTGQTGPIVLSIGQTSNDNDAGVEDPGTASLSGVFFCDEDETDTDTAGDTFVSGATVQLLVGGLVVATTVTADDGSYSFTGLDAGTYQVKFLNPTAKVFVGQDVGGDDAIDSDVNPADGVTGTIALALGEAKTDIDAGVVDPKTASLGDKVFLDLDGDGQQGGVGEVGVDDVVVTLFDGNNTVVATTSTTNGGRYLFSNLAAGVYTVGFAPADTFVFTSADQGNDAGDSDANQTTGLTGPINLAIGEANLTIDAGLVLANIDPEANRDVAKTCANEQVTVNALSNDSDPDGNLLTITSVAGQAISEGDTIDVDGVSVSLIGGQLVFDGSVAFAPLAIGQEATVSYDYTISDGQGGTAASTIDLTFCGSAETVQDIYDSLPAQATYQVVDGRDSNPFSDGGFDLRISGTGDARLDGIVFDAYCLDFTDNLLSGGDFAQAPALTGDLLAGTDASALEPNKIGSANGQSAINNLDLVNYIIAQDYENDPSGQYSGWEVQFAIWELTNRFNSQSAFNFNPAFGQAADTAAILADARANGEGFVAEPGDKIGLIVDPNPATSANAQPFILVIDYNTFDCLC